MADEKSEAITDCELIAHFVKHIYAVPLSAVVLPGQHKARKVAVVICAQLGLPADTMRAVFDVSPTLVTLWCLELGMEQGRSASERMSFLQMVQSCRSITRKYDPNTRRMEPMMGDAA